MGYGYVSMTAGELGLQNPEKYEIFNRGHNGFTVTDILKK